MQLVTSFDHGHTHMVAVDTRRTGARTVRTSVDQGHSHAVRIPPRSATANAWVRVTTDEANGHTHTVEIPRGA